MKAAFVISFLNFSFCLFHLLFVVVGLFGGGGVGVLGAEGISGFIGQLACFYMYHHDTITLYTKINKNLKLEMQKHGETSA